VCEESCNINSSTNKFGRRNRHKMLSLDLNLIKKQERIITDENMSERALFEEKLHTNDTNLFLTNINSTVSTTLDSMSTVEINKEFLKDENPNTFRRKSNFYKRDSNDEEMDNILNGQYKERGELVLKNLKEIEEINEKYANLTMALYRNEIDRFCDIYRKQKEEHMMLENNLKEEINLLNCKKKTIDSTLIHVSEHEQAIDDMNFNFEMQRRILMEKLKYYNSVLNEAGDKRRVTELSNLDNTNFNFTASSLLDKSVFFNVNRKVSSDEDSMYGSVCFREGKTINAMDNFVPKFFHKEK